MIEVTLAANIVHKVLFDGRNYVDAVDDVFPNERKTFQSSNISVFLAKLTLKHYYLFENVVNEYKIELKKNEKCLLYVVLANNFYGKFIPRNNINSFLESKFASELFSKISPILKRKESLEDLITFEKDSDFYYATKYNVPIWLIHMWRKHFDDDYVKEFLEASMNYNHQSYVVNSLKSSTNKLLLKYPDFSSPFDDVLIYNGTKRYNLTQEFKNDEYFDTKIGFKVLIDEVFNPFDEVLLYSGYDDDFVKTAIVKTNGKQSLNVACPSFDRRAELLRFIRENKIKNVNLFTASDEFSLKAGVSYKLDTVVVFPESTRFDIVSKYPDFLLHFDRDSLDSIIEGEKFALELCSNHVDDEGTLVYIVNTLNKKESTLVVSEFLEKHPEFVLDREEQLIVSHPFATTMYYAIMNRRGENND